MKNLAKKIMSLFMVFAVSASVSYMVSAESEDNVNELQEVGNTTEYIPVILDVEPAYVVNIPAQVTLSATRDIQSMPMSVKLLRTDVILQNLTITTKYGGSTTARITFYYNGDGNGEHISCDYGIAFKAEQASVAQKTKSISADSLKVSDGNGGFKPVDLQLAFQLSSLPTKVGKYGAGVNEDGSVKPATLQLEFLCQ